MDRLLCRTVAMSKVASISVGMFKHVGIVHYDAFFRRCAGE
jgi:cyclopropane fatty-acyl-phospholipid synthase-like methyltransferase